MRNWLRKLREDERGLTLVELLAVVVILAIVGAIAFVSVGKIIENSKKDAHVANALQVISAAKLYEAAGGDISADEANPTTFHAIDTIEDIVDPWTKDQYTDDELKAATLTKSSEGEFKIVSFASEGCSIAGKTEKDLRKDGRKACN